MTNPDSAPKVVRGRESVNILTAIMIQSELARRSSPPQIYKLIENIDFESEDNIEGHPVVDALLQRFMSMYATEEYNGFAKFCDAKDTVDATDEDRDLMNRLKNNSLTDEDYKFLYQFIVANHPEKLPLFRDEAEVEEFLATVQVLEEV